MEAICLGEVLKVVVVRGGVVRGGDGTKASYGETQVVT